MSYLRVGAFFALLAFLSFAAKLTYQAGADSIKAQLRDVQNEQIRLVNEKQIAIDRITKLWLEKEPEKQVIYETINRDIIKYVSTGNTCNLTFGAASLLNKAGDPDKLQTDYHPSIPDDKKPAASNVTQLESIETCAKWGEAYNKLARQHDKLIEVLDKSHQQSAIEQAASND